MKNKILLMLLQISFFGTVSPASHGREIMPIFRDGSRIDLVPLGHKISDRSVLGTYEAVDVLKEFLRLVLTLQSCPSAEIDFSIPCRFYVSRHDIRDDCDRCCHYIMRHLEILHQTGGVPLVLWNEYFNFARELLEPKYSLVPSSQYSIVSRLPMLYTKLLHVLPIDLFSDKRSMAKNMIDDINALYHDVPQEEAAAHTQSIIYSAFYIGSAGGPEAAATAAQLMYEILRDLTPSQQDLRATIMSWCDNLQYFASDPERA